MEETILQFGTGRFLRCFVGIFAEELNASSTPVGRIVAVQSTGSERADQLNARQGVFCAAIRGLEGGRPVDRLLEVRSIGRGIAAASHWADVLEVARSPRLGCIVSNTTEAGLALSADDASRREPPVSFPAKVLAVLAARHESGQAGVAVLPCELVEENGRRLRDLVLAQAIGWQVPGDLVDWIRDECCWYDTLVDRIVAAPPANDAAGGGDPLFAVAEPFASWIVEGDARWVPLAAHEAVTTASSLAPYHLRKVRILNGAHTALVAKALPLGIPTVRRAVEDGRIRPWLESLLFEEIVPAIADRVGDAESFARTVLERFANPFLEHRLADIALHHPTKVQTRLRPTLVEFEAAFGRKPRILAEILG
ncbi:MAG: mannitol dehydrogenase family protein [Thermoguttaceae bacterium]